MCIRDRERFDRHGIDNWFVRTKDFVADGVCFGVALDAFRLYVLDDARHVGVAEATRLEDRPDLRPGSAHLVSHAAFHHDLLHRGVEFRGGVAGEVGTGGALQSHGEGVARVVEPGEMLGPEKREVHVGVNIGIESLNTTFTALPMASRSKSQSTRLVSIVTPSSSVT